MSTRPILTFLSPAIAGLPFVATYAAIAWLCWVPNLAIAEKLLRKQAGTPHP